MNIYIFRPHKEWEYMGGGLVVVAEEWEDILEMVVQYRAHSYSWMKDWPKQLKEAKDIKLIWEGEEERVKRNYDDIWVCIADYELAKKEGTFAYPPKPHVVLYNYNDG